MSTKFAGYDPATGLILGFYDSVDYPVPKGVSAILVSDAEWQRCLTFPGHVVREGKLIAPVVTLQSIYSEFQEIIATQTKAAARIALSRSDKVIMLFFESGMSLPKAWKDYRLLLRNVMAGKSAYIPPTPDNPFDDA